MQFYPNQLFHIYNQGNNQRQVFYSYENYEFFLYRLRGSLRPYGDIISYCLMPNHFHILFFVRRTKVSRETYYESRDAIESKRRRIKYGAKAIPLKPRQFTANKKNEMIPLNFTIGNIQKGYARAINSEKGWSGSLFRAKCKVKDGMDDEFVTTFMENGKAKFDFTNPYARTCIRYIHDNPVKGKLVARAEDYQWSSAKEYAGLRNGTLCNLDIGRKILGSTP